MNFEESEWTTDWSEEEFRKAFDFGRVRKPLSLSVLKTTKGSTAAVDAALSVQPVQQEEAPAVQGEDKQQADTTVQAAEAFDKKARAHKRCSEQADATDANMKKKRVEGEAEPDVKER